jgi:uncharacterized membrane protein (DUF2068 family)
LVSETVKGRVTTAGVRSLAVFEAAKGLVVLALGFGLLRLIHRDVQHAAQVFVQHLHLPVRVADAFLLAASRIGERQVALAALFAFAYAALRLAEAYGLWRMRAWGRWVAILSAGLYLPLEVYELAHHPSVIRAILFATNVAIVVGLLYVQREEHRGHSLQSRSDAA